MKRTPIPSFDDAFAFIMRSDIEGGYVNDPLDPGGETHYGISRRAYPHLDIKALTRRDAKAMYHRDYWLAAQCDALPPRLAIAVFDCAVNQGVGRASRLLQRALGVRVDGKIGPITLAAGRRADETKLIETFLSWRLSLYARTANADRFMRGWARRVLALHALLVATPDRHRIANP